MKVAYLFLVHLNPRLIRRAIAQLRCEGCGFFVHVDAKADINCFESLRGGDVRFVEQRVQVFWGEFSQVEAIVALMRLALASLEEYDYFVLLSGSDYPLRSGAYISRFLELHKGTEFMTLVKVPNDEVGKPLSRLTTLRFPSSRPIVRAIFRVLGKFGLATRDYRKCFGGMEPYAGSTWWALTRQACEFVLKFYEGDQHLAAFFRNSFASDESYFHTILGNSGLKSRMRRNLLFEDWSAGGAHPSVIDRRHVAFFEEETVIRPWGRQSLDELLFARKFSEDKFELIDRIDSMIVRKDVDLDKPPRNSIGVP